MRAYKGYTVSPPVVVSNEHVVVVGYPAGEHGAAAPCRLQDSSSGAGNVQRLLEQPADERDVLDGGSYLGRVVPFQNPMDVPIDIFAS